MGLANGLVSAMQGVAATVAQLVGQVISALRFTASAASGADAFVVVNNGARVHLGAGANDYLYSDGATIWTPAGFSALSLYLGGTAFASGGPGAPARMLGNTGDAAGSVSVVLDSVAYATPGARITSFRNATVEKAAIDYLGKLIQQSTDSTGAPGAATINKPTGRSSIALGAATVTITSACVSAASLVFIQPLARDATGLLPTVTTTGAGSFVVTTVGNCTADLPFNWVVIN